MSISVFFVFERTYDGFQLLCAHFAHALYRTLGPDAQRPAREHSGAQPHGGGAGPRARRHPARHIPRAVRRQRPRDGGAVSRRVARSSRATCRRRSSTTTRRSCRPTTRWRIWPCRSCSACCRRSCAATYAGVLSRGQERRHLPAREGGRQALGLHQVHRGAQGRQQRVSLRRGADARGARCLASAGGAVFSGTFHSRVRARS